MSSKKFDFFSVPLVFFNRNPKLEVTHTHLLVSLAYVSPTVKKLFDIYSICFHVNVSYSNNLDFLDFQNVHNKYVLKLLQNFDYVVIVLNLYRLCRKKTSDLD